LTIFKLLWKEWLEPHGWLPFSLAKSVESSLAFHLKPFF
jgi:hypothetical protein